MTSQYQRQAAGEVPARELELVMIDLEHDRTDAEAHRARAHDLVKLNTERENARILTEAASKRQLTADRIQADEAADTELNKLYHQTIAEVSVAGVDRARDGAKFVQTAATAIFAVYTGLLALVYSVTDNPLPLRGAWAGLFLGLSIAFATAYLAFMQEPPEIAPTLDRRSLVQCQYSRTASLTRWVKASVHTGQYSTRAAVISLTFGVLFIAAPFLSTSARAPNVSALAAPEAPSTVATGFESAALELFRAQVKDYKSAVAARAETLSAAKTVAATQAEREESLNRRVTVAAFASLAAVLLGPSVYTGLCKILRNRQRED